MKNNKAYVPRDAIARHENFETWYEDGSLFLRFESDWKEEKSRVSVFTRLGGESAEIKPDHACINYYLRLEQWEHCLHCHTIFKHYYVEGMLWDIYGSFAEPPFDFITETRTSDDARDGHVKLVNFRDRGECFEVRVKDISKLRIAVVALVAMGIKEEYKGLSEGEDKKNMGFFEKIRHNWAQGKGKTYEQVLAEAEVEEARAYLKKHG